MAFLPKDLTAAESEQVATITRQLFNSRSPQTPEQVQQVREEANQIAAETIWEARAQSPSPEALEEKRVAEASMAEDPYHQLLARRIQKDQEMLAAEAAEEEAEEEAEAAAIEALLRNDGHRT